MSNGSLSVQPEGFRSLEFDLPSALLRQIVWTFDEMEAGALRPDATAEVPNGQGVYQLHHAGRLVYIGKTDAQAGLRQRLSRHAWTIRGRHKLAVEDMSFKAIQVLVFSAMDLETALIAHYRAAGQAPAWNRSGFGSNDPGRQRDKTALKADGFDANYPISIDVDLDIDLPVEETSIRALLDRVALHVPYTLRYERTDAALTVLEALLRRPSSGWPRSVRDILRLVCSALPTGWQATRLPGRIILYREAVDDYPGAEVIAQSPW